MPNYASVVAYSRSLDGMAKLIALSSQDKMNFLLIDIHQRRVREDNWNEMEPLILNS